MSDEKLRLIRRLAVQARNTDTGDESVNFALNAIMDGFDTLLDEIARLRAEVARLEAGRLKPETAFELRALLITFPTDVYEAEVDDFFRCYPEEE